MLQQGRSIWGALFHLGRPFFCHPRPFTGRTFLRIRLFFQRLLYDFTKAGSIRYISAYFQSILRNLLSNSLKYKDPDRPLQITVTTKKSKDGIQLVFSDTASGMDMKYVKDRLFIPFTRFSNLAEGKGIGLYMIKSMVENNGGSVTVDSKAGEGTTFSFTLVPYE